MVGTCDAQIQHAHSSMNQGCGEDTDFYIQN